MLSEADMEYFKGFVFPTDSLALWAERYKLDLSPIECPLCEGMVQPNVPFATKTMRGIVYNRCNCEKHPAFMYRAADPIEAQQDREFAKLLYEEF